jgi:hypothetical protein
LGTVLITAGSIHFDHVRILVVPAIQEAVPRHRVLDFFSVFTTHLAQPMPYIGIVCLNKKTESGLQATVDAVAPFWGNTMQFMQFPNLHLYSPICALRIGAMQPPEESDTGPHVFVHNFVGPAWIRMQSAF